jgi:hypothetical protein
VLGLVIEALVVIVNGDRQHLLGMALADHVIVQHLADFLRRRDAVARLHQRRLVLLADDVHAEFDALVADEYGRTRNEFADFVLALSTERAIQRVLGVARANLTHSCLRPPFDPLPDRPIPALIPGLKVDRANSVPEKTLTQLRTVRITASRIHAILTHPTQPTMLTPDYQEFANQGRHGYP